MSRIVAAFNMTLDGYCDHTAVVPDEEIHQHYNDLMSSAGAVLFGRKTYRLMEDYWPLLVENPSGEKVMDEYAEIIQNIPKIVFSHTLENVTWENSTLAKCELKDEVLKLKQSPGKDVLVGSRSLIIELLNLGLIDEFQLMVYPVIAGKGLPFFEDIAHRINFKLLKTNTFPGGATLFCLEPKK